jgi:naphtho-gamma-pyrone polyketide synthase
MSPSGITISGPPESIERLFDSTNLKSLRSIDIGTTGPYHASHLYGPSNLSEILEFETEAIKETLKGVQSRIPVFSTSTGSEYKTTSYEKLLELVVQDILTNTSRIDLVLLELRAKYSNSDLRVVPIGPTLDSEVLVSSLKENGLQVSLFETALGLVQRRGEGSMKSSKIAIVGMSGRFPGGQDVEEFWEMLQKGLDMHKEVSLVFFSFFCK